MLYAKTKRTFQIVLMICIYFVSTGIISAQEESETNRNGVVNIKSGIIKHSYNYVDGKKDGEANSIIIFNNQEKYDTIIAKGIFSEDFPISGDIMIENSLSHYENGLKHGKEMIFSKYGFVKDLRFIRYFKDGLLEGPSTLYFNGYEFSCEYEKGIPIKGYHFENFRDDFGRHYYYFENGQKTRDSIMYIPPHGELLAFKNEQPYQGYTYYFQTGGNWVDHYSSGERTISYLIGGPHFRDTLLTKIYSNNESVTIDKNGKQVGNTVYTVPYHSGTEKMNQDNKWVVDVEFVKNKIISGYYRHNDFISPYMDHFDEISISKDSIQTLLTIDLANGRIREEITCLPDVDFEWPILLSIALIESAKDNYGTVEQYIDKITGKVIAECTNQNGFRLSQIGNSFTLIHVKGNSYYADEYQLKFDEIPDKIKELKSIPIDD
jgi:hypothetical protein